MPTYDYRCLKCGHRFEVFQSISAARLKKCPQCKGKVQREIGGGAGIIFKGSGFYATDYKKALPSASEKAPSTPKPTEEKKKDASKPKPKDKE